MERKIVIILVTFVIVIVIAVAAFLVSSFPASQPIVKFDTIEQTFVLTSSTLFFTPSKSIKSENYAS